MAGRLLTHACASASSAALLVLFLAHAPEDALATTCDVIDAAPDNTTCVAAHSTVRALYAKYDGPLYQVRRASDNSTQDVAVLAAGGFADAHSQDEFCAGTGCVIQRIYDQSPYLNHLDIAPPGGAHREEDTPVNATRESLTAGGNRVYSAYFEGGQGASCTPCVVVVVVVVAVFGCGACMWSLLPSAHDNDWLAGVF